MMKLRKRMLLGVLCVGTMAGCGAADTAPDIPPNMPTPPREGGELNGVVSLTDVGLDQPDRTGNQPDKWFFVDGNDITFVNNSTVTRQLVSSDCPELNATLAPGQTVTLRLQAQEWVVCNFSDALTASTRWNGTLIQLTQ